MLVHSHAWNARDRFSEPHDRRWVGSGIWEQVQCLVLWVEGRQLYGWTDPRCGPEKVFVIERVLRAFQLEGSPAGGNDPVAAADDRRDAVSHEAPQRLAC